MAINRKPLPTQQFVGLEEIPKNKGWQDYIASLAIGRIRDQIETRKKLKEILGIDKIDEDINRNIHQLKTLAETCQHNFCEFDSLIQGLRNKNESLAIELQHQLTQFGDKNGFLTAKMTEMETRLAELENEKIAILPPIDVPLSTTEADQKKRKNPQLKTEKQPTTPQKKRRGSIEV